MNKTLYRSNRDKMIAGICGGLSDYFNMDPTIVRILWVVFTFATNGAGIIAYIVGMFIIPKKPYDFNNNDDHERREHMNNNHANSNNDGVNQQSGNGNYVNDKKSSSKLAGVILIMVGAYFLLREFFVWIDFSYVWPVMLIVVGTMVILKDRG